MKTKISGLLPLMVVLIVQFTFAQEKEITGTVKGDDGMPLPGVNIKIENTDRGTQTDFDGNYSLKAAQGAILKFSYIGFETITKTVDTEDQINVTMKQGEQLEEVTIGYGTQTRLDNTSSVSKVDAEEINRIKVSNLDQAIQGKVAGVQITASDEPGSTPTVTIRGLGTVLGGRQPLYVVDGMFTNNIDNLNPNDIESYQVLKDASALAIYGNRAANGAIIITTKKGKDELSVKYEGNIGIRTPLKKVSMADADAYARYTNAARKNNGNDGFLSENQPYNTDWFDEITRTGIYHEHNVNISGSSDKVNYLLALNNYNEKGVQNQTNYNRTTLRSNNGFDLSKHVTLTQNLSMAFTKNSPRPKSAFTNAYKQAPIVPVRFSNGKYGVPILNKEGIADPGGSSKVNNVGNPFSAIAWDNEKYKKLRLQGGLKLDVDFTPLVKGLSFTSQINGEYQNAKSYNFDNGRRLLGESTPSFDNQLINEKTDYFNWVFSNYFTYKKTFGIHNIEATLGIESANKSGINTINFTREDVDPHKNYWNLRGTNYADNITQLNSINENDQSTLSYFGRVQYKLMNKYMITGTLRRDGSSQFSNSNKWGTFPAFGAGWVVSNEGFLANSDFISFLKIRGGWGRLGNQNIPLNIPTFASGGSYRYSFDGENNSEGRTIDQAIDPNLGWEITEETSGGVDFELLDSRLTGSLDLYYKKTKNIILQSIPISTSGISTPGYSHMGQVSNKGVEIALGWNDQAGDDFSYSVNVNYSHNKNNLDNISGDVNPITGGDLQNGQYTKYFDKRTVGHPLGSFYLWEVKGYDDNGNFTYKDVNDNGATGDDDSNDRQFFGAYVPKSTVGLSISLNYKDWDLSIDGYGAFGNKVYNGKKAQRFSGENIEKNVANDFWTPDHTDAANPAPFNDVPIASTYYLESGDFFRINNVTLGYTFQEPAHFISSIRLHLDAINPFIFQSFSGYSPEINGDGNPYGSTGVELNAYPALSSFVFGVNVRF